MSFFNSRRCTIAFAFGAALAIPLATGQAQRSLPLSDDALVLGFGQIRAGAHGSWEIYDQVYGSDGKAQNYGSALSFTSAGSSQFSPLGGTETGIRSVSGQTAFQLSFGATDVSATHRTGSTALLLDVGLPGRFMVSVEVPFVRVETAVTVTANNGATSSANVGINPASLSTSVFAADTSLANQISRARTALNAQLTSCLGSTAASCTTVNSRRTEAQSLVALSAEVASGVLTIASSPFAPLSTSATQSAITARIASLANSYRDFGINSITGTTIAPATAPITAGQYRAFLESSTAGPGGALPSFKAFTRLGDISLATKFKIVETEKLRAAAFEKVYFPTGGDRTSGELLPISAGEGTTRSELGAIADIAPANRLSLTVSASSVIWLAKTVNVRTTLYPTLEAVSQSQTVGLSTTALRNRRTGFNLAMTPRYAFNRWMMLGAQFESRRLSREQYSDVGIDDIPVWNQQDAITENRIGGGFSFSNLTSSRTTGPHFPIEASFFHSQSISGKGLQPKIFRDEFRIRIFARR